MPTDGFEVFHLPAALRVLDDHAEGDLLLLGGFEGDEPVGLLPVFVRRSLGGTVAVSPPFHMQVSRLGPVFTPTSPRRSVRERQAKQFVAGVCDALADAGVDVDAASTLVRLTAHPGFRDPRPFRWRGFRLSSKFTYQLPVGDREPDELLASFSKSLRREIRDGDETDVTVRAEGDDAVRTIYEDTRARYEEQGEELSVSWSYVSDLTDALGDRARAYVARDADGSYRSGITVLYSNDAAYFWQGGTRASVDGVSVNSLIHWRIIRDIAEGVPRASVDRYDLFGGNDERHSRYKAKFGGDLVRYDVVESTGPVMDAAKWVYARG